MSQVAALAPWAVRREKSRGRLHPEPDASTRSPWQRDRDRIIHSSAFRKLQYKTQVFVNHEGDFYRTRLTHSIEVAQIARSVARELGLDEDLTEALALAHDLGHPPFGHAGEEALSAAMKPFGGFDHNAQSLRVVTLLEARYAGFDGLNLTWETLEGLAKHNGPVRRPSPLCGRVRRQPSARPRHLCLAPRRRWRPWPTTSPITATIWTTAGGRSSSPPPTCSICRSSARRWPRRGRPAWTCRRRGCATRPSAASSTAWSTIWWPKPGAGIADLDPANADDIRQAERPVVGFSEPMAEANRVIKEFLFARMYRHWRVNRMTAKARRLVAEVFTLLHGQSGLLPDDWRARAGEAGTPACGRGGVRLHRRHDRPLRPRGISAADGSFGLRLTGLRRNCHES